MGSAGRIVAEKEWREVIDLYFEVKSLIAYAEISDEEQRLHLPAILEMRSALDHLMRVMHATVSEGQGAPINGIVDDPRPNLPIEDDAFRGSYCRDNLSKAKGHLYRAAYDVLDVLVMSALADYDRLVRHFDFDDICEALPDEFPTHYARIEKARRMVVQCKMFKDVEPGEVSDPVEERPPGNAKVIGNYLKAHEAIRETTTLVRENTLGIRAAVRRRKHATFKVIPVAIICSLLATAIVAVALWVVQYLPAPQ